MDKIRICQFPVSGNNGIMTYATNNWDYIDKSRFTFDFVVVRERFNPAWEERMLQSGAKIKYLLHSAEREPERYTAALRDIFSDGYDVVHLHTSSWKRLTAEQIAVECGIPKIIVHSHSTGLDIVDSTARCTAEQRHNELKAQFTPALATDFCACSKLAAEWLFGESIPRERIQILKNGIHLELFQFKKATRARVRAQLGLDGCFVIGHVGRFSYQKNHEFLLEVFRDVCGKRPSARLLLAGSGPTMDSVRQKTQKLGISEQVIFLGVRNDIPQLMQAFDVFCLPSHFEGLPLVLIEAQAAGLPCLTSNHVTEEVCISENITRIPLCQEIWVQMLTDISAGYTRKNMYQEISNAGYNIKTAIKKVEELYSAQSAICVVQ